MQPTVDNLESDHFIARKAGPYYDIVEKETGEVRETTVRHPLPRKRYGQLIRSKAEALSGVLDQELGWLKNKLQERNNKEGE